MITAKVFLLVLICVHTKLSFSLTIVKDLPPSCPSQIFCRGELLKTVQTLKPFSDGKTFVDLKLKYPEQKILSDFEQLKKDNTLDRQTISKFVDEHFENCHKKENHCEELLQWHPEDWKKNPTLINKLNDNQFLDLAVHINNMWKILGRRMSPSVKDSNTTTLIYLPNGLIIPGGRFREIYYWDSYWIIKGLLTYDMAETARGMIENLLHMVKLLGHVPNGSRLYYSQRSQPPMLLSMAEAYYQHTKDWAFIRDNIEIFEKEVRYFLDEKLVDVKRGGKIYSMFRYYAPSQGPRPESYKEDYDLAFGLPLDKQQEMYTNLKSAAESGWDFSSRWFINNGSNQGTIKDIATQYIIPVDLNSLMHKNLVLLSKWYKTLGNDYKSRVFQQLAQTSLEAIETFLWSEKEGIWFDYDNLNSKPRDYFYMSNFTPLWTRSYKFRKNKLSKRILDYINNVGLSRYSGGSPSSMEATNEQWDFPNAWAPLQAFLIQGLDGLNTNKTKLMAKYFGMVWLNTTNMGYKNYKKLYEKYNCMIVGRSGSGGEYEPQDGFGWTNGFISELLQKWFT